MEFRLNKLTLLLFLLTFSIVHSQENNEDKKNKDDFDIDTQHPLLSNRFTIYAGVYNSTKGIRVGVNGTTDNKIIDFSEKADFNENETTFFLNFNWRFSRMWTLSAEYFGVKNGINKNIDENLEWEDVTYNGGAGITLGLNLNMYRIFIGRTISKGLKHELGAGLGAHVLDIETSIEGYAFINNDDTGEGADVSFEKKAVDVVAPLPNIGAWYLYAPTQKWMFTARIDWFALSINEYSGSLWDLGIGANYQFHKNIGVGLNYRYFDFTANVDKNNWEGKFSLIFQGPLLTLNANF